MKKLSALLGLAILLLVGCGGSGDLDVSVEQAPEYQDGVPSDLVVKVTEGDEPVTGITVTASLEMEKMDHGHIEAQLEEVGDGLYSQAIELPMGGEWIAEIHMEKDGKLTEKVVTFDVKER